MLDCPPASQTSPIAISLKVIVSSVVEFFIVMQVQSKALIGGNTIDHLLFLSTVASTEVLSIVTDIVSL